MHHENSWFCGLNEIPHNDFGLGVPILRYQNVSISAQFMYEACYHIFFIFPFFVFFSFPFLLLLLSVDSVRLDGPRQRKREPFLIGMNDG